MLGYMELARHAVDAARSVSMPRLCLRLDYCRRAYAAGQAGPAV